MAYSWKIMRAAVEQEIQFPSRKAYTDYTESLWHKGLPYEVLEEVDNPDGTVTVIMRKRYNPQNAFLPSQMARYR